MGCGSGAIGKSRSAGVFVVSIIFSTRTPGSIARESMVPKIRAAMAAAITHRLVRAFTSRINQCFGIQKTPGYLLGSYRIATAHRMADEDVHRSKCPL